MMPITLAIALALLALFAIAIPRPVDAREPMPFFDDQSDSWTAAAALFGSRVASLSRAGAGLANVESPAASHPQSVRPHSAWPLSPSPVPPGVSENFFAQRVDHFNASDQRSFQQRFFMNATAFRPSSTGPTPVFLVVGSESAIDATWVQHWQMNEFAGEFGALIICLEHRNYGKSIPEAGFKHLTVDQVLCDIAVFHDFLDSAFEFGSFGYRVILFGGSYGGSLALMAHSTYPQRFFSAVASSPPMVAAAELPQYTAVLTKAFGPKCGPLIEQLSEEVSSMLSNASAWPALGNALPLCAPLSSVDDAFAFSYYSLFATIGSLVQASNTHSFHKKINTQLFCSLVASGATPLQGFASFLKLVSSMMPCLPTSYSSVVRQYAHDPFFWLECNELGYWKPLSPAGNVFQSLDQFVGADRFASLCAAAFNDPKYSQPHFIDSRAQQFNARYGGLSMNLTRAIVTNGDFDPWYLTSANADTQHLQGAGSSGGWLVDHLIAGTAHMGDSYDELPLTNDPANEEPHNKQAIGPAEAQSNIYQFVKRSVQYK